MQPPLSLEAVPRPRNLAHRTSAYSPSRSRQTSTVFPLFHSSLSYAMVRDFAYPPYNPMHYGPVDELNSAASTAGGEWDSSRRVSDPPPWDASNGPWRDSSFDNTGQPLPNSSFGLGDENDDGSRRMSRHRKSKSYTNMEDYARGRRRSSREVKGPYGGNIVRDSQNNRGPGYDISIIGDMKHPPFREDSESVPYSPSTFEDHRPESASLDESYAGPSLALYDFAPENDNELELKEGQIIQVGYRHGQGWLVAMNIETGEQGLVPEEYVRLLSDIEGWGEDNPDDANGEGHDDTTLEDVKEDGESPAVEGVAPSEHASEKP